MQTKRKQAEELRGVLHYIKRDSEISPECISPVIGIMKKRSKKISKISKR